MSQKAPEAIDQRLVQALAHPLRVQILEILSERISSPNRLSQDLETELTHVAYHTRALRKCGCLELVDTAKRRGATEHFYKASPGSFVGGRAWRKIPRSVLGGVSAATLQTFLDKAIAALEAGTLDGRGDTIFRWMPLLIDQTGWDEVVAVMEEATNLILAAHRRSQDRLTAGESQSAISTVVGLASFETAGSIAE